MANSSKYRNTFPPQGAATRTPVLDAVIELSTGDLPAYCPNRKMPLWATHPRVFLDVVNEAEAMCPYCGTRYRLKHGVHVHDHQYGALNLPQHRRSGVVPSRPEERRLEHPRPLDSRRSNPWADSRGNTSPELITAWFKRSQR